MPLTLCCREGTNYGCTPIQDATLTNRDGSCYPSHYTFFALRTKAICSITSCLHMLYSYQSSSS